MLQLEHPEGQGLTLRLGFMAIGGRGSGVFGLLQLEHPRGQGLTLRFGFVAIGGRGLGFGV